MATYFSINNGNFTGAGVFAKTLSAGDVTGGTNAAFLSTGYSDQANALSDGSTIYGVAVHLSSCNTTSGNTLDLRLSASNGTVITESFPLNGFTSYVNSDTTPTLTQSWQLLAFSTPVTISNGANIKVSLKSSANSQISLFGTAITNSDKYIVTNTTATPAANDVVHVGGVLTSSGVVSSGITYNNTSTGYFNNFYVHKGGVLTFDNTTSCNLYVSGANGFQISPEGIVNIGTMASPVPASITHTVALNTFYINVHTGGVLNVYGAPKTQYAYLLSDSSSSSVVVNASTDVSSWRTSDLVVMAPSAGAAVTSFDVATIASFDNATTFRTSVNPTYAHSAISYVPTVMNMTRNVKFRNTGTTTSYLRLKDAAAVSINNAQFINYQTAPIKVATSSLGSLVLSSCAISGAATASAPAFALDASKTAYFNLTANNNNFYNFGASTDIITFNATSATNVNMSGNVCMKSAQTGISLVALSATNSTFANNWGIGSTQHGFYVKDPLFSGGSIGGFGYRNSGTGTAVAGTSAVGAFNGIGGFYNFNEGCNISGNISNLGSVVFSNISASNNTTAGVSISGNSQALTSPVSLNVNGVVANNNGGAGFEGYSITGNLSSMTLNNNYGYGVKTSIGNAATVFDGVSSEGTIVTGNTLTKIGTTLSVPTPNSNFNFPSGVFTVEAWVRFNSGSLTNFRCIVGNYLDGSNGWYIETNATGKLAIGFTGDGADIVGTTTLQADTWYHVAVAGSPGSYKLFLNGVQEGATFTGATTLAGGPLYIGKLVASGNSYDYFNGYISNLRIVNGTALYTSDFNTSAPILPATPLTLVPNTVLLYNDPYGTIYKDVNSGTCAFGILSAQNYFPTVIKSAKLTTSTLSGYNGSAILLDSSKFEQFTVESSTLSSYQDVKTLANCNYVEGSYQFNNCTFTTGILSSTLTNYQPEIFLETGFAAMKVGGVSTNHFRWTPSGKISSDTVRYYGSNGISEKLEPISATKKLRCGSKMIPVNSGDTHTVSVYVYSTGPTPRLMLKKNASLGYSDTVLATTGTTGSWVLLTGSIPAAASAGIFEVYVDCSGTSGSVNVDNWTLI